MTKIKWRRFIPDTPKELSFLGAAIVRLGTTITGIGAFQDNTLWILLSAGLTWVGYEVTEYFKIHIEEDETKKENT